MVHQALGRAHAATFRLIRSLAPVHGQGTVEYVALILLVATVLAGVVTVGHGLKGGGIAEAVVHQLKQAISGVSGEK
jgi:hypothetical protein